jgi:lipooligosaccharide transport system permease protein
MAKLGKFRARWLPGLLRRRPDLLTGAGAVWWRHIIVYRTMMWASLTSNVFEPLLLLFAFGYGLGAIVGELAGLPYLVFILPGMMAYTAMFAASFESTVSAYARFRMQKTWDAMLATPLSLTEILLGELLWCTTKAMIAATCVFIVGAAFGGVPSIGGGVLGLFLLVLAALCFGACGHAFLAYAKGWDFFNYVFTFWVTPMFIFSGVFFEVTRFPEPIQLLAWVLPMTHVVAVLRPLTTGQALSWMALLNVLYVAGLAVVAFLVARRRIGQRMFD